MPGCAHVPRVLVLHVSCACMQELFENLYFGQEQKPVSAPHGGASQVQTVHCTGHGPGGAGGTEPSSLLLGL